MIYLSQKLNRDILFVQILEMILDSLLAIHSLTHRMVTDQIGSRIITFSLNMMNLILKIIKRKDKKLIIDLVYHMMSKVNNNKYGIKLELLSSFSTMT